jgi:hypothetical protein
MSKNSGHDLKHIFRFERFYTLRCQACDHSQSTCVKHVRWVMLASFDLDSLMNTLFFTVKTRYIVTKISLKNDFKEKKTIYSRWCLLDDPTRSFSKETNSIISRDIWMKGARISKENISIGLVSPFERILI